MSVVLSNGYKKPESGDLGTTFFPDLEFNIDRVNGHSHNGTDSNKLTPLSYTIFTAQVLSGDFSVVGDEYRATVNLPAEINTDTTTIRLRDPSTKEFLGLRIEKQSTTQFYLFSMFAIDVEVVYG